MIMNKTAVLLIAASAAVSAWAQAPAAVGKLSGVQGLVTIGAGDKLVNAVTGAPLVVGNRIVTTSSGAATLAFDSGCVVSLKANESVVVTPGADCKALLASVTPVGGAAAAGAATGCIVQARPPTFSRRCSVSASSRPLPVGVRAVRAAPAGQRAVMPPASRAFSSTGLAGPVAFGAGLLLLAFAPIIRGGNRHVAMVLLEWLGLLVLLLLAVQWAGATRAPGRGTAPRPVDEPFRLRRRPVSWPGAPVDRAGPAHAPAGQPVGGAARARALCPGAGGGPGPRCRVSPPQPRARCHLGQRAGRHSAHCGFLLAHTCTPRSYRADARAHRFRAGASGAGLAAMFVYLWKKMIEEI